MNKLIVCGPPDFTDDDWLVDRIHDAIWELGGPGNVEIVSSYTAGPDAVAREYADKRFVKCATFKADWDHQGRFAGSVRNAKMREHCYGHRTMVLVVGEIENVIGIKDLIVSAPADFIVKKITIPK